MYNKRHVAISFGRKHSKSGNDGVLFPEAVHVTMLIGRAHHELDVVDDHVTDVVDVGRVFDRVHHHFETLLAVKRHKVDGKLFESVGRFLELVQVFLQGKPSHLLEHRFCQSHVPDLETAPQSVHLYLVRLFCSVEQHPTTI